MEQNKRKIPRLYKRFSRVGEITNYHLGLFHTTLLSEEDKVEIKPNEESLQYLTDNCNGKFYIDVGNSSWLSTEEVWIIR